MTYRYIPVHEGQGEDLVRQLNTQLISIERAFAAGIVQVPPTNTVPPQIPGLIYWFEGVPGYEDGLWIWDGTQWLKIGPTTVLVEVKVVSVDGTGNVWDDVNVMDFTGQSSAEPDGSVFINTNTLITFYHNDFAYDWIGDRPKSVGANGTYTSLQTDFAVNAVGNAVTSVHGRIGDVVGENGDYTPQQVGADPVGSAQAVQDNLDTHEAAYNPHNKMTWKGAWNGGSYQINDVVEDNGWLMAANQFTTERPAPQPTGPGGYAFEDLPPWSTGGAVAVIYSGHTYTFSQGGWVKSIRVWAPTVTSDTTYRVGIIDSTDPDNIKYEVIVNPVLNEGDWTTVALGESIVTPGAIITVFLDVINSASETIVSGNWVYETTQNLTPPPTQGWNKNQQQNILRIDKTDSSSNDRTTDLMSIEIGSTIEMVQTLNTLNYWTYRVQDDPVDQGTYVEYSVILNDAGGNIVDGQSTTMTATIPVPQAANYVQYGNFWLGNQPTYYNAVGKLQFDGVDQPGGVDIDGFGVDIDFIPGAVSDHWDLMAHSENVSGTPGGGAGEVNSGDNIGTGLGRYGVYGGKIGTVLNFKSLHSGDGTLQFIDEGNALDVRITGGTTTYNIGGSIIQPDLSEWTLTIPDGPFQRIGNMTESLNLQNTRRYGPQPNQALQVHIDGLQGTTWFDGICYISLRVRTDAAGNGKLFYFQAVQNNLTEIENWPRAVVQLNDTTYTYLSLNTPVSMQEGDRVDVRAWVDGGGFISVYDTTLGLSLITFSG